MARFFWALAGMAFAINPLRAGTETREYVVLVNGKEAGQSTIVIVDSDDGKTYMKGSVSVKVPGLVFPFTFTSETQEWWQKDRLTNLVAVTIENGKKTEVNAKAEVDRVLVSVNGQARAVSWEVWTSSFWKLADRRFHNKDVPILEPDSGKDMVGKLEFVAAERIKVGAQMEDCYRFRVIGIPSPTDLWFDRHHRLVRQEFTENNQKTIVQLMSRKN
jgi:hypothetical protein